MEAIVCLEFSHRLAWY